MNQKYIPVIMCHRFQIIPLAAKDLIYCEDNGRFLFSVKWSVTCCCWSCYGNVDEGTSLKLTH